MPDAMLSCWQPPPWGHGASLRPLAPDVGNSGGGWHICQLEALKTFKYGRDKACLQQSFQPHPMSPAESLVGSVDMVTVIPERPCRAAACPCTSCAFPPRSLSRPLAPGPTITISPCRTRSLTSLLSSRPASAQIPRPSGPSPRTQGREVLELVLSTEPGPAPLLGLSPCSRSSLLLPGLCWSSRPQLVLSAAEHVGLSGYPPDLWPHPSMALTLPILRRSKVSSASKSPRLPPTQQLPLSRVYSNPLTIILIHSRSIY